MAWIKAMLPKSSAHHRHFRTERHNGSHRHHAHSHGSVGHHEHGRDHVASTFQWFPLCILDGHGGGNDPNQTHTSPCHHNKQCGDGHGSRRRLESNETVDEQYSDGGEESYEPAHDDIGLASVAEDREAIGQHTHDHRDAGYPLHELEYVVGRRVDR